MLYCCPPSWCWRRSSCLMVDLMASNSSSSWLLISSPSPCCETPAMYLGRFRLYPLFSPLIILN